MPAQLVPLMKTPYAITDMVKALMTTWYKIYNAYPSKESIGVIFSQWSLETGQGKSCYNNNFFNVKYISKNTDNDDVKYFMLPNTWEIDSSGQKVIYQPPDPQTWFLAFDTLNDCMQYQFDLLMNKRYKEAWTAVESGNPAAFAHLLKLKGYYTAPEADYVKGLNFFFNKFMKDNTFDTILATLTVIPELPTTPAEPDEPTVVNVPAIVIVEETKPPPDKISFFKSLKDFFFGA